MEILYNYLGEEFKDFPFCSMNIKPSYYIKEGKNGPENIITLTVYIYDKFHNILSKQVYRFINDQYKISDKKPLKYITPEDFENAFKECKNQIINLLYNNDFQKYNKCLNKLHNLENYVKTDYNEENSDIDNTSNYTDIINMMNNI